MTRSAVVAFGAVVGLWPLVASAQDKDADAERFFREGQKLMEERRFGEACPKFDAAYRKDQQLGTLLNLAYCHKEQGAVWQAWLEFKEAELKAAEQRRPERKDFARQRMAELEKTLARVVVDGNPKIELVEVLVEDRRVPEAEKGITFAAEPGQRKFTFRAKGKKQVIQLVSVSKGSGSQHIPVPEMEEQPKDLVVVEAPPPVRAADSARAPADKDKDKGGKESTGPTQRTIALVVGGAGLVAVGVGSVFGLMTFISGCSSLSDGSCQSNERSDASDKGVISTVAFVSGGLLLGAAAALWFTAPPSRVSGSVLGTARHARSSLRVTPELGAGWAGLRGTF